MDKFATYNIYINRYTLIIHSNDVKKQKLSELLKLYSFELKFLYLRKGSQNMRSFLSSILITLILLGACVYSYDRYLIATRPAPSLDLTEKKSIRDQFLYPYSGFHIGADARHIGPMPSENMSEYKDFDIQTGDHGFWVNIDLENPPQKAENEIRILFIGGSSGQGFGASTNSKNISSQLENLLNDKLKTYKKKVRVFNLAMAGTNTYENSVALNLWGHNLEPDLIISFSGGNDISNPSVTGSVANVAMPNLNIKSYLLPKKNRPRWFNQLTRIIPGLTLHSIWGQRMLGINNNDFAEAAQSRFRQAFNTEEYFYRRDYNAYLQRKFSNMDNHEELNKLRNAYLGPIEFKGWYLGPYKPNPEQKEIMFDIAMEGHIHAIKSIKRDFSGVPILMAFQPIDMRQYVPYIYDDYQKYISTMRERLTGYYNDDWYFLNLHEYWDREKLWKTGVLYYGVHMMDKHQKIVAELIADKLAPELLKFRKVSQFHYSR